MIRDVFSPITLKEKTYKIRHIELKKRRKGMPIVFLPGIGGFAESYKWNLEGLYKKGYWPMAVDHIGFGKSDKPLESDYSLDIFSLAIAEWMKNKKLKNVVLVGNSFGGGISIGIWDIVPKRISAIILVSSAGFGKELLWNYRIASLPVLNEIIIFLTINRYIPINNGRRSWKSIIKNYKDIPDDFLSLSDYYKDDHEIRRAYTYVMKNMVSLYGQPKNTVKLIHTITKKIKKNKVPVLVVWGKEDQVIPYQHGVIAKKLTNGKLELMDECGHMPYFEYPELFNKIVINFLNNSKKSNGKIK
ncbi:MAG: alpha/beta hydrolase [Candidatus Heimdallarchaeota archaeon]|nr:alpha/beta hydrolase [Candidatus Heimdallarchaeota archaeon]